MNIQKATELINDFIDVWELEQVDDVMAVSYTHLKMFGSI